MTRLYAAYAFSPQAAGSGCGAFTAGTGQGRSQGRGAGAMCGRFYLLTDLARVLAYFGADGDDFAYPPPGDFLPGQTVAAVLESGEGRVAKTLRWGFVPAWAGDPVLLALFGIVCYYSEHH